MKNKNLHINRDNKLLDNVTDHVIQGDPYQWKCILKVSTESEGWMKSTKVLEIPGKGCFLQVTTQQKNEDGTYSLAEALTWASGVELKDLRKD